MINCPRCNKPLANEVEFYNHLRDVHRLSPNDARRLSGWFEPKKETPEGELKALEHQVAALKVQKQKEFSETLTAPLSIPAPKREAMKIPSGWSKGIDNSFIFERTIGTVHTASNVITKLLRGKVTSNHGELILYKLDKNISELALLQEKESTLASRQAALVIDDESFPEVSRELHDVRKRIREMNKMLKPEQSSETVLEDYYYGELGSEENEKWQAEFIQKCLNECDRLTKNSKNESDSDEN